MSDRKRAPRGGLDRETVVAAAVEVMKSVQTVEDLTVARVADRLGVGAMSLYTHIRNKDDLVRAVAVALFQPLEADQLDTREDLLRLYRAYYDLLVEHPALVQIVSTQWGLLTELHPTLLTPVPHLGFLTGTTADQHTGLVLLSALSRYTLGCAALHNNAPVVDRVRTADDGRDVHREIFEFGLLTLIDRVVPAVES